MTDRRRAFGALIVLAVLPGLLLGSCKKDDDEDEPRIKKIRLFSVDSVADRILELNAVNGKVIKSFLAPGPGISGAGCGLAYDGTTKKLWFHDSDIGREIWMIDPDNPDPTGTAVALPTLAISPDYDALAHEGTFLLALDPVLNRIDWLNPMTGDFIRSISYPEDLAEGLDATSRGLYGCGQETGGEWVIRQIDFSGGVIRTLQSNFPGFMPRGLGLAQRILFVADMGNLSILVVDLDDGSLMASFPIQGATSVCGLAAGRK